MSKEDFKLPVDDFEEGESYEEENQNKEVKIRNKVMKTFKVAITRRRIRRLITGKPLDRT
jgi:RNase P protein component